MSGKIIDITSENFDNEVMNSSQPVLVDFWAEWCGPCRMMGPVIEQIAEQYPEKVKVGKVNVDSQVNLASKFRVMSIPTIMIFNNGEVIQQVVGARTKDEFVNMLDDVIKQ
ncbi:MAG: thioredoxin [Ignavibacteriales bacterium]